MRIHPLDGLLFLSMKLLKSLDYRDTDLNHFDPERVRNILVVSSTAIGDTLLSTPAIRAVRKRYPRAKIVAHLNRKNMELFENNSHVDSIIPYDGGYRRFLGTVREFRRHKFDLVLIFHGNEPQATPMAYLSGARFIIKVPMSGKYGFLLSNTHNGFDDPMRQHVIDLRLKAASFAGCGEENREMTLVVGKDQELLIERHMEILGLPKDAIIVGFQVGAASGYKAWPGKSFVELGRRLTAESPEIHIVMTGSQQERDICDSVAERIGKKAFSVAGDTPLKLAGAMIRKMKVLVTNDTGPMHMAIALQVKTVSLFCPTNVRNVGPSQDLHLHRVIKKEKPCDPCVAKKGCEKPFCMELITVDEVYGAVKELLSERAPAVP